jgi:hypothetical protein
MKITNLIANVRAEASRTEKGQSNKSDPLTSGNPKALRTAPDDWDQPPGAWRYIEQLLQSHFLDPDIEAAKVLFACAAAHRIADYPPAWLMMIGPPGSMKTVLLESTTCASTSIRFVDEVTANTFISGRVDDPSKQREAPAGLLHRIGAEGILVNADFGTIINMNRNVRGSVLAQLRRIYDGCLCREFGTEENLSERLWQGRLTLLAGATPDVDKYHAIFQALGERFLYVRLPRAGGKDAGVRAMQQTEELKSELAGAVCIFLSPVLDQQKVTAPRVPQSYLNRLASLGEIIVRARADVPRHRYTRKMEGEPVIESNTRCPQQLVQLARGSAVLWARSEVIEEDFQLAVRVAFDSIPPIRAKVFRAMMAAANPYTVDDPKSMMARSLEDLAAVDLAHGPGGKWMLTDLASELLRRAGLFPQCHTR